MTDDAKRIFDRIASIAQDDVYRYAMLRSEEIRLRGTQPSSEAPQADSNSSD